MKLPAAAQRISTDIWSRKYRFGDEADLTATWRRVAAGVAMAEDGPLRKACEDEYFKILDAGVFSPAGRIISGAGTGRNVTLFNCFVMGTIEDNMSSILGNMTEASLAMQRGGGIGHDFSPIRPKGSPVIGVGAEASGPVSFMDVWDASCKTIMSAGTRRGAMMATLRCDHPDIEDFVTAKRTPGRLRNFNVSVLATNDFMSAVKGGRDWPLMFGGVVHKVMKARELWDLIMRSAYDFAEPGVIFIDVINRENNLNYCEHITATNPCGEQPLPPYGACLLGSINLARLVVRPFTANAFVDWERYRKTISSAVRFLDSVIDVSRFPLEKQREEAYAKRRLGLGITGLADAMIMSGIKYNSLAAVAFTKKICAALEMQAYEASALLAKEKGVFPLYDPRFLSSHTVARLPHRTVQLIEENGIRNGLLTSIAPTGTISLVAGNVSSGIEPVFAYEYSRNVRRLDDGFDTVQVRDYAYDLYCETVGGTRPDYFVDVNDLLPQDHIAIQAAAQMHIDSSISKTVNVPRDWTFEQFSSLYVDAYEQGLKGCTAFRPNDVTGSILIENSTEASTEAPAARAARITRDAVLAGKTYKLRWPLSMHAVYVTINNQEVDGVLRPMEIFIQTKEVGAYAWIAALTRMISAVLRREEDVQFIADELRSVFDPAGGAWCDGKYQPSLLAAIGDIFARHLAELGLAAAAPVPVVAAYRQCPDCGAATLIRSENCDRCISCEYNKCS